MPEPTKLEILRAKTDRELVAMISRQLERGLRLAAIGYGPRGEAEKAYTESVLLLPRVYSLAEAERRRLESKLEELRQALAQRPTSGRVRATAC
jgi:hypothetical protein